MGRPFVSASMEMPGPERRPGVEAEDSREDSEDGELLRSSSAVWYQLSLGSMGVLFTEDRGAEAWSAEWSSSSMLACT